MILNNNKSLNTDKKVAVVLFNLGGPDKLENVKYFLYNLFSDKWIIRLPLILRKVLAFIISRSREKEAQKNYSYMGGYTPLLKDTQSQRDALKNALRNRNKTSNFMKDIEIFISMRYWHPFSMETIKKIEEYNPDEIIMLPLYPQLSSSTTISSFEDFEKNLSKSNINAAVKKIGCYFDEKNFLMSHIELIRKKIKQFHIENDNDENINILFSAHSIPEKFVKQGDPYEWQINKTYNALKSDEIISKYNTKLCYQSKVGPVKWLGPSTEEVITDFAKSGKNILIVPIAFVSEHIETLVELDIEYKEIADKYGIKMERVPALGINKHFINSLASMVEKTISNEKNICCFRSEQCPQGYSNCVFEG